MIPVRNYAAIFDENNKSYWNFLKDWGHQSDGCSGVPDFGATEFCVEHDFHYREHRTVRGEAITRRWADSLFYERLCAVFPKYRAAYFWTGVRLFGYWAWAKNDTPYRPGLGCPGEAP